MAKKNPNQTGTISIPVLAVIISTLCAVALILAFTFLFRTNSEIVHGNNSNEAVSFTDEGKLEQESQQPETAPAEESQPEEVAQTLLRPAPADAVEGGEFRAPSGNIACTFNSGVACTIYEYTFKASDECKNAPITFSVNDSGTAANCSTQVGANTELAYGQTMKNGGYACAVSESGVDCWSEKTGDGFTIARETASYTQN